MAKRLFGLDDADNIHCTVWRYSVIFSSLQIKLTKSEHQVAAFSFTDVLYFSGPMSWRGAKFREGDKTEFEAALRKLSRFEAAQKQFPKLLDDLRLYIVRANQDWLQTVEPLEITIVASTFVNFIDKPLTLRDAEFPYE